jgi:Fur family transcriptional regulator, stress-responsive regulator
VILRLDSFQITWLADPVEQSNFDQANFDQANFDPAAMLRAAGLRVTGPRVVTLQCLNERPHASVDDLEVAVRERIGAVSTQAIYDIVRACTDAGIVRRIEPAGSSALYELRVADNHHHLICRVCRSVVDVDCAAGRAPCLDVTNDHGYVIDEAEVVYWGICPACAASTTPGNQSEPLPTKE